MTKTIYQKHDPEYWADWLVDAVATMTQNRRLLRGEPEEDTILTEAIEISGKHAIKNALKYQKRSRS